MQALISDTLTLSIGQAIKQLREERGWTQAEAVARMRAVGVELDQQLVSRRESGAIKNIKPPERKKWAEVFGLTVDAFDAIWRGSRTHDRPAPIGIPIINKAAAGVVTDYDHDQSAGGEFHGAMEYADRDAHTQDPEIWGVYVVGDSMSPTLFENDQAIFKNCDERKESPALADGKIVHVRFAKERKVQGNAIYRFFWEPDRRIVRLRKDNRKYADTVLPIDIENIASIACLVQLRRSPENM